jgi:ADP-heptose:LPS heptosyltransferase
MRRGPAPQPLKYGRCLVVALDGLGDLVLRQPLLRGLADAGYEVHVLVQAGYEGLLRFLDDRLRGIPAPLGWTIPPAVSTVHQLLDQLHSLDPALVVSAQFDPVRYADWIVRSLPGAFAAGFAGGAVQEVPGARAVEAELGLPDERPLDLVATCEESTAETEKARRLLAALTGRAPSTDPPTLTLGSSDRERASIRLQALGMAPGRFVVCYPAGTKNVTLKAWPADRYGAIAAWISRERGMPTLVMGHGSEAAVVEEVVAVARAAGGSDVRGWCSGEHDLDTMIGFVASASLYVGNDTGAMHVAAAAGVAAIAPFGGGHWPRFLPVARRGAVHTRMLPCFGCGWRDCIFFDGPCVGRVEEEAVRASVARVLDGEDGFEVHPDALPLGEADWTRAVTAFRALSSRAADSRQGLRAHASPEEPPAARLRAMAARIRHTFFGPSSRDRGAAVWRRAPRG